MKVSFGLLWGLWSAGVVYDLAVVAMGAFPQRDLHDRMWDDFRIAWFVIGAYVIHRLVNPNQK
jgi:hypothetical protein